jgi:hypothetical protein
MYILSTVIAPALPLYKHAVLHNMMWRCLRQVHVKCVEAGDLWLEVGFGSVMEFLLSRPLEEDLIDITWAGPYSAMPRARLPPYFGL